MGLPGQPVQPAHVTITVDTKKFDEVLGKMGLALDAWQRQWLAAPPRREQASTSVPRRAHITGGRRQPPSYVRVWLDEVLTQEPREWRRPLDARDVLLLLPRLARIVEENKQVQRAYAEAFREIRNTSPDEDNTEAWARWQALGERVLVRGPRAFTAELAAHDELLPCVDLVDGYRFGGREVSPT